MPFSGIGSMRWRVVIQTPTVSGNSVTGYANTSAWTHIETMAAGPEGQIAGQVTGQVNYLLTFRTGTAVTANNRVVWSGKTLRVQSVRMVNTGYQEALCVEKQ